MDDRPTACRTGERLVSAVALLMLAVLSAGTVGCQQSGSFAAWSLQPRFLLTEIEHFRMCVHADPEQALPDRMAPETAAVFQEVVDAAYGPSYPNGKAPAVVYRRVWRFFFDTSIYMVHYAGPKSALVLFYNPYSDTGALLRWDETDQGLRVGDAEVVTGDYLRGRHKPPYAPAPGWRAYEGLASAAVAETAYETAEGFGRTFAGLQPPSKEKLEAMSKAEIEALLSRLKDWRSHAPGMAGGQTRKGNRVAAGVRLRVNLLAMDVLQNAPQRQSLLAAVNAVFGDLAAGRAMQVLAQAGKTLPATARTIREQPPADWGKQALVCCAVEPGDKAAYVFTTRWDRQNAFVCVSFEPGSKEGTWSPTRIDYVNCREYARLRQKQATGDAAGVAAGGNP